MKNTKLGSPGGSHAGIDYGDGSVLKAAVAQLIEDVCSSGA